MRRARPPPGCVVIDNTSQFRMEPDVPLVVPEVNPQHLAQVRASAASSPIRIARTIQMVVALKPLHDGFTIRRVVVSTYQSVSGAGKEGMDELFNHTKSSFVHEQSPPQQFTKEIAFNCIPHIDKFMDDGSTKEEWKMVVETKKILDPDIAVHATCVRVPVFIGHGEAVNVEFENPVTAGEARAVLREAPGIAVIDLREDGGYVTPAGMRGRGRRVRQPHPQGPDRRARAVVLVRLRQSAQGCGAERGADRRDADRAGAAGQEGRLIVGSARCPRLGLTWRSPGCSRSSGWCC